ncbi:MAG: hypothetical protein ABR574_13695 [Cryomorphaceae bacterium]|nr:hypothetical protein [Flavobacteriales bacterium]
MQDIIEFTIRILPYLIIAFTLIYLVHESFRFIKSRDQLMLENQKYSNKASAVTAKPIKDTALAQLQLQAAERFVLYLERIAPDRLVMRLHQNGMDAKMLQTEMSKAIREEFDHNLSQQLYVSEGAWELIKNAKEEMIRLISATGESMPKNSTGLDYSRKLFQTASKIERLPSQIALQYLRKEARQIFNR